ncbi:MAG: mevalonate kinase [Deltaproteobacteria bacterium]|nr:mevalonate kinase [Deltaproteobacteria bacterium]
MREQRHVLRRPRVYYELEIQRLDNLKDAVPTQASACGKVILIGEHAVLYGADAIALPLIQRRVNLSLIPSTERQVRIDGVELASNDLNVIDDAFRALDVEPFPLRIEGSSQVLLKAGLGSSAAFCIALLRLISQSVGKNVPPHQLAEMGKTLEQRFHGKASGLDPTVVAYEKVVHFNIHTATSLIDVKGSGSQPLWHFCLIDSGERASTKRMVEKSAWYFTSGNITGKLKDFNALTRLAKQGLESGQYKAVAQAMNEASQLLTDVGIMTRKLQEIIETAHSLKLLGAKVTGAGGGGCVLGLLDPTCVEKQKQAMIGTYGIERVINFTLGPAESYA